MMAFHSVLRKISNLENLLKALAEPQLLQAAHSFEINNPSGNFFSGPRLTARERKLILDWTPKRTKNPPWALPLSCVSAWSLLRFLSESHHWRNSVFIPTHPLGVILLGLPQVPHHSVPESVLSPGTGTKCRLVPRAVEDHLFTARSIQVLQEEV